MRSSSPPGRENAPGQTWRKYISRLLVMWVAWSAFYTVMSAVFLRTADPLFLLQHLWDGYYHLWYLLALTGVYALIPLLQRVVASPGLTRYFLILTGIPSIAVPTLAMVPVAGGLTADLVARVAPYLIAGYPFYFVLGHVLHEKGASALTADAHDPLRRRHRRHGGDRRRHGLALAEQGPALR